MTLNSDEFDEITTSAAVLGMIAVHVFMSTMRDRLPFWFGPAFSIVLLASRLLVFAKVLDSMVGGLILPATYVGRHTEDSVLPERGWKPLFIENKDVQISAGIFTPHELADSHSNRWLLFLPPNGMVFEQLLPYLEKYANAVKCNVIGMNYRGVGKSTGWPYRSSDFVSDGNAVVKYILNELGSEKILIHGWSIGGGIGGGITCDDCIFISDRSFSRISDVAAHMMDEPVSGAILGSAILGGVTWAMVGFHPTVITGGIILGGATGALGMLTPLSVPFLKALGWEIDVINSLLGSSNKFSRVIVLYHRNDGVIHYEISLDRHLAKNQIYAQDRSDIYLPVELETNSGSDFSNHMFALSANRSEWKKLLTAIEESLD
mmetsp:Transcript_16844/g.21529  ORF Transcript_16844/g.21529 Transcript_16844/m.21529 type:complete len:376 (+) Transcript_16844:320-1447(+)